mmetsp:Transcript_29391/g.34595  ORF Transcript_29391/g.34595 Transcript_29391/m.34595 type:complete len:211 (+) Transcript_29391:981-1613(+)
MNNSRSIVTHPLAASMRRCSSGLLGLWSSLSKIASSCPSASRAWFHALLSASCLNSKDWKDVILDTSLLLTTTCSTEVMLIDTMPSSSSSSSLSRSAIFVGDGHADGASLGERRTMRAPESPKLAITTFLPPSTTRPTTAVEPALQSLLLASTKYRASCAKKARQMAASLAAALCSAAESSSSLFTKLPNSLNTSVCNSRANILEDWMPQ